MRKRDRAACKRRLAELMEEFHWPERCGISAAGLANIIMCHLFFLFELGAATAMNSVKGISAEEECDEPE